jgi:hypothetical protein
MARAGWTVWCRPGRTKIQSVHLYRFGTVTKWKSRVEPSQGGPPSRHAAVTAGQVPGQASTVCLQPHEDKWRCHRQSTHSGSLSRGDPVPQSHQMLTQQSLPSCPGDASESPTSSRFHQHGDIASSWPRLALLIPTLDSLLTAASPTGSHSAARLLLTVTHTLVSLLFFLGTEFELGAYTVSHSTSICVCV